MECSFNVGILHIFIKCQRLLSEGGLKFRFKIIPFYFHKIHTDIQQLQLVDRPLYKFRYNCQSQHHYEHKHEWN
jgi:hypothetical protein